MSFRFSVVVVFHISEMTCCFLQQSNLCMDFVISLGVRVYNCNRMSHGIFHVLLSHRSPSTSTIAHLVSKQRDEHIVKFLTLTRHTSKLHLTDFFSSLAQILLACIIWILLPALEHTDKMYALKSEMNSVENRERIIAKQKSVQLCTACVHYKQNFHVIEWFFCCYPV